MEMQDKGARKNIEVTLSINGKTFSRTFTAFEVHHIEWDPEINDMADVIENSLGNIWIQNQNQQNLPH